jgi:hypothetical protein
LVRPRTANDRARLSPDAPGDAAAHAAPAVGHDTSTRPGSEIEKCINCQFYDRRNAKPLDGKAPLWGQCRRHSPRLNPVTAKTYVVEGVWPLVRDDDWCGEWKILTRIVEEWIPDMPPAAVEEAPEIVSSRASPAVAAIPAASAALGD